MPVYYSFYKHHTDTILGALSSVERKIVDYYVIVLGQVGTEHKEVIQAKSRQEVEKIERVAEFLRRYPDADRFEIDLESQSRIMNVIRSALEIYLREISALAKEYDIEEYGRKVSEIGKILGTEVLRDARADLYEKYYHPAVGPEGRVEFFISYSNKDKKLAGEIKDILVGNGVDAFLAHRDIGMSKEWRDEILAHLESCTCLIAVCTSSFICSAWGNQEAGIAREKGRKLIPLFAEGVDKRMFGFLSAIQGPPKEIKADNLNQIIGEIVETFKP